MRKKIVFFNFLILIFLIFSSQGCLFNDKETGSEPDWNKVSIPSSLLGKWYVGGYVEYEITGTKVFAYNRDWVIEEIALNNEIYRIIARDSGEYKAFYFKSITDNSAQSAVGWTAYTLYESKNTSTDGWFNIDKK